MDRKTELELIDKFIAKRGITRLPFDLSSGPQFQNWRDLIKRERATARRIKGGRNRQLNRKPPPQS